MFNIMRKLIFAALFFVFFNALTKHPSNKKRVVFIDTVQKEYYADRLFLLNKPLWGKARERFAQEGILLTTNVSFLTPALDCYVLFNSPHSAQAWKMLGQKKVKKILMAWEPPAVDPKNYDPAIWRQFDQVMTFHDDVLARYRFKRFNYCFPLTLTKKGTLEDKKKLCTLIASNKKAVGGTSLYALRNEIIQYFSHNAPQDFDVWGHGWPESCPVYRGIVDDKLNCMSGYKFAFCFENSRVPGYITEKIFDAFAAGCVPIYCGAPNIGTYIPRTCFIDFNLFKSIKELHNYLATMSDDEYQGFVNEGRAFLMSPSAQRFSYNVFIEQLLAVVQQTLAAKS